MAITLKCITILLMVLCTMELAALSAFAQVLDRNATPISLFLPVITNNSGESDGVVEVVGDFVTLSPSRVVTEQGEDGGQPVTNLHVRDQSGAQNDWNRYIEFMPSTLTYRGHRIYVLPTSISPADAIALQVKANYMGASREYQTWTWSIYNWTTNAWVVLGDNNGATWWQWKFFTFGASGSVASYINSSTREIKVRVESNNTNDNMDLDYEAVVIEMESTPTSTSTHTPTATPTPIPATSTPTATHTPVPPTNTPVVSAREFYVALNGSDNNVGSINAPWRTIQHAANNALPGSTVFVRQGVYAEKVTVNVSGSSEGGYITFRNYVSESVTLDGTGLVVAGDEGLFKIVDRSYIVIQGFELANLQTNSDVNVPAAIWVQGTSHHIQLRNNRIRNIKTGARADGNAHGIAVYGSSPSMAISQIVIDGNEIYDLQLGNSEALVLNGNVDGFEITHNHIHHTDNIGIDVIGWEGVAGNSANDQARNGVIRGNTIHDVSSYGNPAYGNSYAAAGVYVDGGRAVTIEQNTLYSTDYGVELASEHEGKSTSFITVRNNFIYNSNAVGIGIGGFEADKGRTDNCVIINNTLFNNGIDPTGGIGELYIQYNVYNNTLVNNILVASTDHHLIYSEYSAMGDNIFTNNLYYAPSTNSRHPWVWKGVGYTTLGAYRTGSGNDGNSLFAIPQFVSTSSPDLHLLSSSPAINAGMNRSDVGAGDINGETRIQGAVIDIGADEVGGGGGAANTVVGFWARSIRLGR